MKLKNMLCAALAFAASALFSSEVIFMSRADNSARPPLHILNVTPTIPGREEEIVRDVVAMYQKGIIHSAGFSCTLVPEGNPPADKATALAKIFAGYAKLLKPAGIPTGVLLQATMGHGWTPAEIATFQRFTFRDGRTPYMFCPLDNAFLDYVYGAVKRLVEENPDFVMLDDDTRMITGRNYCFCPLHLQAFNEKMKTDFTCETLAEALAKEPEKYLAPWDALQRDSVVGLAKTVRRAIDSVSPEIPTIFCCCCNDLHHVEAMARTLAAPGQRPVVRINNAIYNCDSLVYLPNWMHKTACQVAAIPKDITLLAETDTCPQTLYSMSAQLLHLQISWSLLNGCSGGKLWITQTAEATYDDQTGLAYRAKLGANVGFYQALAAMNPEFEGIADILPPAARIHRILEHPTWGTDFFARTGIPFAFRQYPVKNQRVALAASQIPLFTDAELAEILKGKVLLDGPAAIELTKRGFAGMLGFTAETWHDLPTPTWEKTATGIKITDEAAQALFTKLADGAEVRSTLYHGALGAGQKDIPLTPAGIRYKNAAGGEIYAVSSPLRAYPGESFNIFRMLRFKRKMWMAEELDAGMFYAGTAPVYFARFTEKGTEHAIIINSGLDALPEIELGKVPPEFKKAERLTGEGAWQEVEFDGKALKFQLLPAEVAVVRFDQ